MNNRDKNMNNLIRIEMCLSVDVTKVSGVRDRKVSIVSLFLLFICTSDIKEA